MVTLVDQIDLDVRCLEEYFKKLFDLLNEQSSRPIEALDASDRYVAHGYTAFVRPDMASNIYSLVDFWLSRVCELSSKWHKLSLGYKDIRGKSELDARHKYLTKIVGLDLSRVSTSYQHLDVLREVRNCLLHEGGHARPGLEKRLRNVPHVSVVVSLVCIGDAFIWQSLTHAQTFLVAAAEALEGRATP